jgi:hypothetical protein
MSRSLAVLDPPQVGPHPPHLLAGAKRTLEGLAHRSHERVARLTPDRRSRARPRFSRTRTSRWTAAASSVKSTCSLAMLLGIPERARDLSSSPDGRYAASGSNATLSGTREGFWEPWHYGFALAL